jgi:hypothetical protein
MSKEDLEQLWVVHQNIEVDDMLVLDLQNELVLPSLSHTELGKTAECNAHVTATGAQKLFVTSLTKVIILLLQ